MRLLVMDDDTGLCSDYAAHLRDAGFAVDTAWTLAAARRAIVDVYYDALVLDRLVPDGDALDLVIDLRNDDHHIPVLLLSGLRAADGDRVAGLRSGADDYVAKPIWPEELVLRVRALVARGTGGLHYRTIRLGRVQFDPGRQEVHLDNRRVHLTPTQYRVFEYLVRHRHRLVHTQELLEHCWDRNQDSFGNAVHSQVTRLRRIFRGALRIELSRGKGYVLTVVDPR